MMVYVERRVADDATLSKDEAFGSIRNQLCTFREGEIPQQTYTHTHTHTHINAQLEAFGNDLSRSRCELWVSIGCKTLEVKELTTLCVFICYCCGVQRWFDC